MGWMAWLRARIPTGAGWGGPGLTGLEFGTERLVPVMPARCQLLNRDVVGVAAWLCRPRVDLGVLKYRCAWLRRVRYVGWIAWRLVLVLIKSQQ